MGDLHCLNVECGDASVIISGPSTFLVDCHKIGDHSQLLPKNKAIRGVFITHQHEDHYSGLCYLKDEGFSIDHLIYSPYDRRYGDTSVTLKEWNEFNSLKDHFANKGTKLHYPYRQEEFTDMRGGKRRDDVAFEIIGPHSSTASSPTREIHDACLVIKTILGNRSCLFTGDASDANLEYIADKTNNYCNDILHASHHGSLQGAYLPFIKGCNAKYTLILTASGVYENVPHPTALKRYQDNTHKHLTSEEPTLHGTWHWTF